MLLLFAAIYNWYIKNLQKQGSWGKLKGPYCSLKGTKTSMMWSSWPLKDCLVLENGLVSVRTCFIPCHCIDWPRRILKQAIFKLINYSCGQTPINDDHLGQLDEFWYLMKHQIKHQQVFIWFEICFSSEIKHLHFNEMFYWLTQLMETMQYQRKHITA